MSASWRENNTKNCVEDPSATGQYVDPHRDAAFELAGPHCTYASRIGAEQARCALRRERIVFLGDSTMRQLFAAVACKLDGSKRPRVRQPGNLPKRSDDGRWPLKWVVYKNMVGSNQCEPEVVEPKGTEKRRKEVLQFTWDVPGGDDIRASFHWAEHADDIERIAAMGAAAVPKGDANATIVIANVGLYYPAGGTELCSNITTSIERAMNVLLNTTTLGRARVFWIETQTLPYQNSRKFLTEHVACSPSDRREQTNAMRPIRDGRVTLVRTHDVLAKNWRFSSATDLHQQYANEYRADVLFNHIGPLSCLRPRQGRSLSHTPVPAESPHRLTSIEPNKGLFVGNASQGLNLSSTSALVRRAWCRSLSQWCAAPGQWRYGELGGRYSMHTLDVWCKGRSVHPALSCGATERFESKREVTTHPHVAQAPGSFERKEMLFVHIPKTGGTTIEAVLKIPKNHALAFDRFQELERPTTFTVAVVRNPWDRALSWYRFCVAGAGPPPHPVAHCTFARKLNLGLRKSPGKKSAAEANALVADVVAAWLKTVLTERRYANLWVSTPMSVYVTHPLTGEFLVDALSPHVCVTESALAHREYFIRIAGSALSTSPTTSRSYALSWAVIVARYAPLTQTPRRTRRARF